MWIFDIAESSVFTFLSAEKHAVVMSLCVMWCVLFLQYSMWASDNCSGGGWRVMADRLTGASLWWSPAKRSTTRLPLRLIIAPTYSNGTTTEKTEEHIVLYVLMSLDILPFLEQGVLCKRRIFKCWTAFSGYLSAVKVWLWYHSLPQLFNVRNLYHFNKLFMNCLSVWCHNWEKYNTRSES